METSELKEISYGIPKAELHMHIEGSFEPELVLKLAKKNNIGHLMNYSVEELSEKYQFTCLKHFLDLYYECCDCLIDESDFEQLMFEFLQKSSQQGLKYAEIFFDPQTHLKRNISFQTVINGLQNGCKKGKEQFGIEANLIMCFLRDLSEEEAFKVWEMSEPFRHLFIGVGLDSNEHGNPPEKFKNIYETASKVGMRLVAHCGEECSIPTDYFHQALDVLKVSRIDHGVQIVKSEELIERAIKEQFPLTMCPLSNLKLQVHKNVGESPIISLLKKGVLVTINSDDPAYFGGYVGDNYFEVGKSFNLSIEDFKILAINSFKATFLDDEKKEIYIKQVKDYIENLNLKSFK